MVSILLEFQVIQLYECFQQLPPAEITDVSFLVYVLQLLRNTSHSKNYEQNLNSTSTTKNEAKHENSVALASPIPLPSHCILKYMNTHLKKTSPPCENKPGHSLRQQDL